MSYYRVIKGISYDRALLEKAKTSTRGQGDGRISEKDLQELWEAAQDGGRITAIEYRTLDYIASNFNATDKAKRWLEAQPIEERTTTSVIERVIKQRLGLPGLQWTISEEEVSHQEALENQQTFEQALFEAIEAIIYEVESSTSLRDVISIESDELPETNAGFDQLIRDWINTGHLYLIPLDYAQQQEAGTFSFKTPADTWSPFEFWLFGLEIPGRTVFNFLSLVRRKRFQQTFSFGYFPTAISSQQTIRSILVQSYQLQGIRWEISTTEIKLQRQLPGKVDFPLALRHAMQYIIEDENDEESVRSVVKNVHYEDINPTNSEFPWVYEDNLERKIREYLDFGILYLVPLSIHEIDPDDFEDIYPAENGEQVKDNWIFMLRLPTLSDHLFWIIVDRTAIKEPYVYGFN